MLPIPFHLPAADLLMPWFTQPAAALAWMGRQGTRAVALSVFAGLALPELAAVLKPAFTPSLFVLLCLAFLRADPTDVRRRIDRPALVLAAAAWIMVVIPIACGLALSAFDPDRGLLIALVFQAAAPPVISAPALAALMGLDTTVALAVLAACAAATPATAGLFAALYLGSATGFSGTALGLRLLALLAGAAVLAAVLRRAAGQAWIERQTQRIDGLSVLALFVFAVAVMDGVVDQAVARPALVLELVALAFATSLALAAATALVFWRAGRRPALTLALAAGLRNLGLMAASANGPLPEVTWLYVALAQFPIYLLPYFFKPLVALSSRENRPSG